MDSGVVSIVVPAFNEARRLRRSLPRLVSWLDEWPGSEVIVVDDGSSDETLAVAREELAPLALSRTVRLPQHSGKGAAVRRGVAVARGDAIAFMDADLATDLDDLPTLIAALEHADVVIGSRSSPGSVVESHAHRSTMRRAFNGFVRFATGLNMSDTQCGFKAFRAPAARVLFERSRTDGLAFDVEILLLATRLGYRVAEVPVQWADVEASKVRPVRDGAAMAADVLRIRRRLRRESAVLEPARHTGELREFAVSGADAEPHGLTVPRAAAPAARTDA